jgi:hypothetical protein
LEEKMAERDKGTAEELQEWYEILKQTSLRRLMTLLESDSERAQRLRQSLPFAEVLQPHEWEQLKKWQADEQVE